MDVESYLRVEGDVMRVTGYTSEEFVMLNPVRDFLSPKADRQKYASLLASISNPDQSLLELDIPYVHKNGHTIWLRACHGSRVIGIAQNGKAEILVLFKDVTTQHEVSSLAVDRSAMYLEVSQSFPLIFSQKIVHT